MGSLLRSAALLMVSAIVAFAVPVTPHEAAAAAPTTPTLVSIRAAHHPTFDRVVFRFEGGALKLSHAVRQAAGGRRVGSPSADRRSGDPPGPLRGRPGARPARPTDGRSSHGVRPTQCHDGRTVRGF